MPWKSGKVVLSGWIILSESLLFAQQSSTFTYSYPNVLSPVETKASAVSSIMVWLMLQPKWFHEFHPIWGVIASPLSRPSLSRPRHTQGRRRSAHKRCRTISASKLYLVPCKSCDRTPFAANVRMREECSGVCCIENSIGRSKSNPSPLLCTLGSSCTCTVPPLVIRWTFDLWTLSLSSPVY